MVCATAAGWDSCLCLSVGLYLHYSSLPPDAVQAGMLAVTRRARARARMGRADDGGTEQQCTQTQTQTRRRPEQRSRPATVFGFEEMSWSCAVRSAG